MNSVADRYTAGLQGQAAQLGLQANPAQPPAPFMPPLEPDQFEQAVEQFLERLRDTVEQAWDYRIKHLLGFYDLPEGEQYAFLVSKGPVVVLTPTGPQLGPWWSQLQGISGRETAKLLTLYRRLEARHGH